MDRTDWPFELAKSLKEAKKKRREFLTELAGDPAKKGEAERIAQCRRGNRCRQDTCPVCAYWAELANRRMRQSAESVYVTGKNGAHLAIDALRILPNRRPIDPAQVRLIAASMAVIGQLYPIIVREVQRKFYVVAGLHRLEAAKALGWGQIWCTYTMGGADDLEVRMILISENLHRGDLRVLDRADHIEEWRQLVRERARGGTSASPAVPGSPRLPGGLQPGEGGIKKTARALGLTPREIRRAKVIASLSPDAKLEARRLRLDNKQNILLAVAKLPTGVQVNALGDEAAKRAEKAKAHIPLEAQTALAQAARLQSTIVKDEERVQKLTATVSANKKLLAEVTAAAESGAAKDDSVGETQLAAIASPPTASGGSATVPPQTRIFTAREPAAEQNADLPPDQEIDFDLKRKCLDPVDRKLLDDLMGLWAKAPVQVRQLFVSSALSEARGRQDG
jgi:ParB family chromosome partitioning protein